MERIDKRGNTEKSIAVYIHISDANTRFYPGEYTNPPMLVIGDNIAEKVYQLDMAKIKKIEPVGLTNICINYDGLMLMLDVADSLMVVKYLNGFLLKKMLCCVN